MASVLPLSMLLRCMLMTRGFDTSDQLPHLLFMFSLLVGKTVLQL